MRSPLKPRRNTVSKSRCLSEIQRDYCICRITEIGYIRQRKNHEKPSRDSLTGVCPVDHGLQLCAVHIIHTNSFIFTDPYVYSSTSTSADIYTGPNLSPTPIASQLTPKSNAINCRSGPDVAYPSLDVINFGQTALIVGKNKNSTWWYVRDPNNLNQFCWVSASVAITSGSLSNLPVIPPLGVIVTNVTVGASVSFSMCGGPNAVSFSGTITTNGAAKVSFQWEIRGDKSNTTSLQTITFKRAETMNAPNAGTYTADCGHYSISLHVLSPNDISAKQNFKIGP